MEILDVLEKDKADAVSAANIKTNNIHVFNVKDYYQENSSGRLGLFENMHTSLRVGSLSEETSLRV